MDECCFAQDAHIIRPSFGEFRREQVFYAFGFLAVDDGFAVQFYQ